MPLRNDSALVIRRYSSRDRQAVRRICCETALIGEPSALFFDDDDIFADALTSYFTDHEPESSIVAEYDNNVVGYLIGSTDVRRMEKIFICKIAAPLVIKAIRRGAFFRKKNMKFLFRVIISLAKGEFRAPIFSKDYPATLHINISKECRAAGIGSKLISAYLDYLRSRSIKGVHFTTMSDKAGHFFSRHKFQLLFRGERSYFRYILDKNVPAYVYGMQLPAPKIEL